MTNQQFFKEDSASWSELVNCRSPKSRIFLNGSYCESLEHLQNKANVVMKRISDNYFRQCFQGCYIRFTFRFYFLILQLSSCLVNLFSFLSTCDLRTYEMTLQLS